MKKLLQRKRIWEVDCISLDASLAASFDWRELANILQTEDVVLAPEQPEEALEMQVQHALHQRCHEANDLSLKIERLLNQWHEKAILKLAEMDASEILFYAPASAQRNELSWGGVFWALGTDNRTGFDCLRRHFFQRLQIRMIRNMKNQAAVWQ